MTTQAQREFDQSYSEFIAAYVEPLEQCRASHDEAHNVAYGIVSLAKECAKLANIAGHEDDGHAEEAFLALYVMGRDTPADDAEFLAIKTITLEMEALK